MPDAYALSEQSRDAFRELVRRRQDGGATAPRDRGPQRRDGGGTCEVVGTEGANDGTEWTPGTLQVFDPDTGDPGDGDEAVDVKPVNGEAFTDDPQRWLARDTGARSPAEGDPEDGPFTGPRRFLVERVGDGGGLPADAEVTITVYQYECVAGELIETPIEITIAGPGLHEV